MSEGATQGVLNVSSPHPPHGTPTADLRKATLVIMTVGTLILTALFLIVMLKQPFEPNDDLIWISKLRKQSFVDLPFSSAWMTPSPFYRPVAEIFLKGLYSLFGLDLTAYRWSQFGVFALLMCLSWVIIRQLRLSWENFLLMVIFAIASPFMHGSLIWLSELPHVIVLVCYAASLAIILSDQSLSTKLWVCALSFIIAVLSKENGLALVVFYFYFVRSIPVKSTLVFGGITAAYFILRITVLGHSLAFSGVDESVGYFFTYLSTEQRLSLFKGYAIYELYAYDILAQLIALFFRAMQWGKIVDKIEYQTILQTCSTLLIVGGIAARLKRLHGISIDLFILVATVFGGTLFSYSYARDRHLALPAFAYGLLLVIAVSEIERLLRSRLAATAIISCVWLAWFGQGYSVIKDIRSASLDLTEKTYRRQLNSQTPVIDADVWIEARRQALELTKP